MQKIILTVTNDLSYDQRMIRICTTLAEGGYSVRLVGRRQRASAALRHRPFEQVRLGCFFEKGKFFYAEYNLRLFFYLLFHRFDLVCSIDLDTLMPGYAVARLKGKPCVYDAHEYFTEVPEVVRRPKIRWFWNRVAGFFIPRVRHAYTVGPMLAKEMTRLYGIPFEVIRNVPWLSAQNSRPDWDGPKIILYQGWLNEGRGLETAISAMSFLEDCELWLAGEGDLSEELRELTLKMGLTDKVRFLGFLQPEDLRLVTLKAHIGLNLFERKGLSYYYSLANKTFDYIQAGVPSVQMDFPEYRHLQDAHGVFCLIAGLDPRQLAFTIQGLLDDRKEYDRIRQNCIEIKKELCWEKEAEKLLLFYREIFSGERPD